MPQRKPCPHCARDFSHLGKHRCPEQPAIVDWLARNLPDPERPGYIVTLIEFESMPVKPLCAPALKMHYGSWAALARRFGLQCPPAKGSLNHRRENRTGQLYPDEIAELRRLAEALHAGAFGPSTSEFDLYAEGLQFGRGGIADRFPHNSWHEVLTAAGLQPGTHGQYARAAYVRQQNSATRRAEQNQRPPGPARRYTYERGDEPIPRDYLGIQALDHNRIDGRRRPSAGYTWTLK